VIDEDVRDARALPDFQQPFDLIATMAVGDPSEIGALIENFVTVGGHFASTVPRETSPPDRIGNTLQLDRRLEGEFGCYAIYRRGV
jgi:hypothetical protein